MLHSYIHYTDNNITNKKKLIIPATCATIAELTSSGINPLVTNWELPEMKCDVELKSSNVSENPTAVLEVGLFICIDVVPREKNIEK